MGRRSASPSETDAKLSHGDNFTNNNNNNDGVARSDGDRGPLHFPHNDRHHRIHRRSQQSSDAALSKTNIYIRGLPPETTPEDLHVLCSQFGTIKSTKAVVDQDTQRCRGYGFVDFETAEAANEALNVLNNDGIHQAQNAREIRPRNNEKTFHHSEQDPTNLYIANLPKHYDEESIRELLSQHGMVISTRVLRNVDGTSRCVGFARMESKDACEFIINNYNGRMIEENGDPLVVKLADSGNRRPKHSTSSSGATSLIDNTNIMGHWQGPQQSPFPLNASFVGGDQSSMGFSPPYAHFMPNGLDGNPNQYMVPYNVYDPSMSGGYPQVPQGTLFYTPVYSQASNTQPNSISRSANSINATANVDYYGKDMYKQQAQIINPGYVQYQYASNLMNQHVTPQPYGVPSDGGMPRRVYNVPNNQQFYPGPYVVDGQVQQVVYSPSGNVRSPADLQSPLLEDKMSKMKLESKPAIQENS